MTLNEYQQQAMTTCMESSNNVAYMFYNLLGEVGELVGKMNDSFQDIDLAETSTDLTKYGDMAKTIRKEPEKIWVRTVVDATNSEIHNATNIELIQKECGDILWQLSGLCEVMGWKLEDIAQQNLDKLASRKQRNQIDGDGDNR